MILEQQHTSARASDHVIDADSGGQNTHSERQNTTSEASRASLNGIRDDKEADVQWTWCGEVDRSLLEQQRTPEKGYGTVANAGSGSQNTLSGGQNTTNEVAASSSNAVRHEKEANVQWTESTYPPFSYLRFRENS